MKKTTSSGGCLELRFVADGLLDLVDLASVVLREKGGRVSSLESLGDDVRRHAGAHEARSPELHPRIDRDQSRPFELLAGEREQALRLREVVALDAILVAPTGTGKTLVAAFDYAQACAEQGRRLRLLFVAHRDRILSQSRGAFAAVLRDPAALGVAGETGLVPRLQGGVFYAEEENADLLFVTLKKTDAGFSPSTMYRDYAMSTSRFHWESQNTAHPGTTAGRRYLSGTSTVLLFVRESQEQANGVAEPYWFLGPVVLESATGERPIRIVWRLEHPMPGHLHQRATLAAG